MLYYFPLLALPPLTLKSKPELSFKEFKDFLFLNLFPPDWKQFELLLQSVDLYNIRAFWLGAAIDDRGTLDAKSLEEKLLVRDEFPLYLIEYLERYETTADRLRYFPLLVASFYREQGLLGTKFLQRYFQFERELRLVLTALRSKQQGRDVAKELQFEDPTDPMVAYILAQKDAEDFSPPMGFERLKIEFVENYRDPEKLNNAVLEFRFDQIKAMEEEDSPFSIDQVLAYAARFLIVDGWFRLDRVQGLLVVEKLSQYG